MKVLLATCMMMPHSGGASTHFELLGRALDSAGMLAGQVVGQDAAPSRMHKVLCAMRACGIKDLMRAETLRDTADLLTKAINESILSTSAELVHCHDALSTYATLNARLVIERRLPVFQTVHGPWSREMLTSGVAGDSLFHREARRIEQIAYTQCTRCIPVDRGQADILIGDFGVQPQRVTVIHNAVDCSAIHTLALARPENSPPEPYFVVPRRLVPKNGVHVAIHAMTLLAAEKVHLAIAGDGPLSASLRGMAENAGLSSRVHFFGSLSREHLMPLMASAVGVIVPSVPCEGVIEATSLSVIESFACGVPVIAANIGGLAELIQDQRTGLLFPAGDVHSLAHNVRRLLRMAPADRWSLCAAARAAVLANWDIKPWFARLAQTYAIAGHTYNVVP